MQAHDFAMQVLPVQSAPGVTFELRLSLPPSPRGTVLFWLPAMGVPARHYEPLAQALSTHGVGTVVHEWRGLGSSSVRASRKEDWGYRELLRADLARAVAACRARAPGARLLFGGHSLGGQLACLLAGLHPEVAGGLVLVASGSPYWRAFRPWGQPLRLAFALARGLAAACGYFPGRRLGFAGNEARGVIADWARSGHSGHYAARGMEGDLEAALEDLEIPVLALRLSADRLVPRASLHHLLQKMPRAPSETHVLDPDGLGVRADHFHWMKAPQAVAQRIADWTLRLG